MIVHAVGLATQDDRLAPQGTQELDSQPAPGSMAGVLAGPPTATLYEAVLQESKQPAAV